MQQHNEILIKHLIEKSNEALDDAKLALDNERLSNAQNRIYYAIFYIVSALGYLNNFRTSKHGQLIGWYNKTYIKNGVFDKELAITYKNAFENRTRSDYEFTYKPDKNKVSKLFNEAQIFVKITKQYLINQGAI